MKNDNKQQKLSDSTKPAIAYSDCYAQVFLGDCLEQHEHIKSGSVDLILTDLPYGTMKGRDYSKQPNQKEGSKTAQDHNWDEILPTKKVFKIANRILRKNGKMILTAQDPFSTELKNNALPNLPYNYSCIWEKSNFANCLLINKACANFYEDILIFSKNHDTEDLHPLRNYLKDCKVKSGMTNKQFNHLFSDYYNKQGCRDRSVLEHYWAAAQFTMPTEEIYKEILQPTGFFPTPYEELKEIDEQFKNDFASTFNLWEGNKYKINIFKYERSEVGYHPTQKPVLLLEDLIKTFSNEGNLVVDLTMGSGSTGLACKNTNRNFIGIEKDEGYFRIAEQRINARTLFS
jgi:site-specific DNA-methyltransferase (adenine-specific)